MIKVNIITNIRIIITYRDNATVVCTYKTRRKASVCFRRQHDAIKKKVNSYFHVKTPTNPVSSYTNEVGDFLSTLLAIFLNNKQFRFIKTQTTEKSPLAEKAPGLLPVDVLASGPLLGYANQPKALVDIACVQCQHFWEHE